MNEGRRFGHMVMILKKVIILYDVERAFSSAKNLITDRRNGLKENIIEAYTVEALVQGYGGVNLLS